MGEIKLNRQYGRKNELIQTLINKNNNPNLRANKNCLHEQSPNNILSRRSDTNSYAGAQ